MISIQLIQFLWILVADECDDNDERRCLTSDSKKSRQAFRLFRILAAFLAKLKATHSKLNISETGESCILYIFSDYDTNNRNLQRHKRNLEYLATINGYVQQIHAKSDTMRTLLDRRTSKFDPLDALLVAGTGEPQHNKQFREVQKIVNNSLKLYRMFEIVIPGNYICNRT